MNIKFDVDSFVNWKRYTKDGETELKVISHNDNFIIKGDNINVLQSLLPIYKNKIKGLFSTNVSNQISKRKIEFI